MPKVEKLIEPMDFKALISEELYRKYYMIYRTKACLKWSRPRRIIFEWTWQVYYLMVHVVSLKKIYLRGLPNEITLLKETTTLEKVKRG
jgi:hypothetical protein